MSSSRPKLSICIPTYNRSRFLPDAFASITAQSSPETELVVSDNASTDDTSELVEAWRTRISQLTYFRASNNQGADRNYLQSVESASGDYCWLHGSDDVLESNAVASVLPLLDQRPAVIVTDRSIVSFDLSRQLGREHVASLTDMAAFRGDSESDLLRYLKSVNHFTAIFPFLSNLIVDRELWLKQPPMHEFVGSAWVHVAKIFSMLQNGGTLLYLPQPLVRYRSGNDSFLSTQGHCRRALIDLDYLRLVDHFFAGQPAVHRELTRIVQRHTFNWIALMSLRRWQGMDDPQAAARLDAVVRSKLLRQAAFWPKLLAWKFTPPSLLNNMYKYKQGILKLCGELRP